MDDVIRVKIVDGGEHSEQELLRQIFRVDAFLNDAVKQISAAHEIHHYIHCLFSLPPKRRREMEIDLRAGRASLRRGLPVFATSVYMTADAIHFCRTGFVFGHLLESRKRSLLGFNSSIFKPVYTHDSKQSKTNRVIC